MNRSLGFPVLVFIVLATLCPNSPASGGPRQITLTWPNVMTSKLTSTGAYNVLLTNINYMLYDYVITINENAAATLPPLIPTATSTAPAKGEGVAFTVDHCPQLTQDYTNANILFKSLNDTVTGMLPQQSGAKYNSIPLSTTLAVWNSIKDRAATYIDEVNSTSTDLSNMTAAAQEACLGGDWVTKLSQLDSLRIKLLVFQNRERLPHELTVPTRLDRTRGGSVVVKELFQGTETNASPVTFILEAEYATVTASGGFLLTTLPARSYSSVNQPPATPGGATTTVLGINGASRVRPALAALFNFHDPFEWGLNKPNFGLALSAGPVIEVANGQSDTTKFGVFAGVGVHLWKILYVTPGLHIGEFADFPQGFTQAGQAIPTNFGTLSPTKRYTGRFAVTITFRGSNPTSLLGIGGSQKSSSQASSTSPTPGSIPKPSP